MTQEMRIRNYSERTIRNYLAAISGLCKYYNLPPDRLSIDQVKSYIYYRIKQDQISASLVNQIVSAWKVFWVDILGQKEEDLGIKRPRNSIKIPEILSRQEALDLIAAPDNLKHRTILTLLYATGLRREELLNLTPNDIDSQRMLLNVRNGKGNKDRQIPISEKLLKLLRHYYSVFQPRIFLFEGTPVGKPYSATSVINITKKNAKKAGIKKNIYPHTLRHCFATHLIEAGTNLKVVQQLMGHSSIKSTMLYLRFVKLVNVNIPNLLDNEDLEQ